MPEPIFKKSGEDMRVTIADAVAYACKEAFVDTTIERTQTTSGCPIVNLTIHGHSYNLTITKSRKP
jgi:hypothetical protein